MTDARSRPAKPMDLSNMLRDAFLAGRGVKDGERLSSADQAAWVDYDPLRMDAFHRLDGAVTQQRARNAAVEIGGKETTLLAEIILELRRARAKFPGPDCTFAALSEEVGEVAKALMEEPRANVRKESVQVAVMAMRIILDGDVTFDQWREMKGLDPLLPA